MPQQVDRLLQVSQKQVRVCLLYFQPKSREQEQYEREETSRIKIVQET